MRVLLKQWRTDAGLTQRNMGTRLRKPHTYAYKVEVGDRRLDALEFIQWCKACNADPLKKFKELLSI
ncbi:MAG: helix-turn-helix domain-containing protein [Phycisphaerales bacterium]|nr:helix-turn-helix domain-containing protein [Phycisphaerales bacterium]